MTKSLIGATRAGLLLVAVVAMALAIAAVAVFWPGRRPPAKVVLAAPNSFSGPVNGGCYLATPTTCRIHVDSWSLISNDSNEILRGFQLSAQAGGATDETLLYAFSTDVSNPPRGTYQPSPVRRDFAARCDVVYQLTLRVQGSGDPAPVEAGRTNEFACPAATDLSNYMPLVSR